MIFDKHMSEVFRGTDRYYNGEAQEEPNITEADLQRIIWLITRIADGYNCKGGDGGCTWEEGELADILERVYRCGQASGEAKAYRGLAYELERKSKRLES